MRFRGFAVALTLAGALISSAVAAGPALAVSNGGYSGANQNCPPGYADNATPSDQTYAGCHDIQLSVESEQTDGHGNPNGAAATHYFDFGMNQEPNGYLLEPCLGVVECVGSPGQNASPHSGCIGANTDGTGSGPARKGTRPESPGKAGDASNGCGANKKGLGFSATFDYYQFLNLVCPTVNGKAGQLPGYAFPFPGNDDIGFSDPCNYKSTQVGQTTVTPYTGTGIAWRPLVDNGAMVYAGADDNTNHGEHDGVGPYTAKTVPTDSGAENGTSDGFADNVQVSTRHPLRRPTRTHPESLVNADIGVICAEGICAQATTQQTTDYYGCNAPNANGHAPCDRGTPKNGNVYNYSGSDPSANSESYNCNSQTPANAQSCGPQGENGVRSGTPQYMNAEPGVQIYEDPDPNRSPLATYFGNTDGIWFPAPGIYAGTCGFVAGSPTLPTAQTFDSTPFGNGAGQLQFETGGECGNNPQMSSALRRATVTHHPARRRTPRTNVQPSPRAGNMARPAPASRPTASRVLGKRPAVRPVALRRAAVRTGATQHRTRRRSSAVGSVIRGLTSNLLAGRSL